MAAAGVIGANVLVKIGSGSTTAILGQRGAKLSIPRDMIDLSVKANYPAKTYQSGWYDWTVDCDCLCEAGGTGGVADLAGTLIDGTEVDVLVEIGSSGEQFTGKAFLKNVELDAPQDKEATVSCQLQGNGTLTATEGT